MSWFDKLSAGLFGAARGAPSGPSDADRQRLAEWQNALQSHRLPSFVEARLTAAASGKTPWVATMSPVELGLARSKGIRPLAMVSGTCWFHYGFSWTTGHVEGWHLALGRMRMEAVAVGANAIVDVKMRKIDLAIGDSMDFTVIGTAVRIDGLAASGDPLVATVPALEFVRLLEAGIVPVGVAIGAQYNYFYPFGIGTPFLSGPLPELSGFWEGICRTALAELHNDAQRQGNGVLAHTHLGQLFKIEQGENNPPRFLGRHIVIGTVVDTRAGSVRREHEIRPVVEMCAGRSPLLATTASPRNAYSLREEEGMI